jgi:hypothetical protein
VCFELQKESSSGQTDELSSCIQGCMLTWIGNLSFFFFSIEMHVSYLGNLMTVEQVRMLIIF